MGCYCLVDSVYIENDEVWVQIMMMVAQRCECT